MSRFIQGMLEIHDSSDISMEFIRVVHCFVRLDVECECHGEKLVLAMSGLKRSKEQIILHSVQHYVRVECLLQ